jgi:anti-sigma regulatory factor (Ser/Thr protein kinase)
MRSFRAHPVSLHEIRSFVRGEARRQGFPADALDDVVLAVSEACANAILHTNSPSVDVVCLFSPEMAEIQVRDEGVFRRQPPLASTLAERGRGIPLMMALMDEVAIKEGTATRPGTLVRLVMYPEVPQVIRSV